MSAGRALMAARRLDPTPSDRAAARARRGNKAFGPGTFPRVLPSLARGETQERSGFKYLPSDQNPHAAGRESSGGWDRVAPYYRGSDMSGGQHPLYYGANRRLTRV